MKNKGFCGTCRWRKYYILSDICLLKAREKCALINPEGGCKQWEPKRQVGPAATATTLAAGLWTYIWWLFQ